MGVMIVILIVFIGIIIGGVFMVKKTLANLLYVSSGIFIPDVVVSFFISWIRIYPFFKSIGISEIFFCINNMNFI